MTLKGRLLSRIQETDWDFAGSASESPFSAIHWHPGRFASQLPAALIGLLSKPGDLILDPFVGSGTTLAEAQRLGRPSIGIDLNPIACLATRAKTLPILAARVERHTEGLKNDAGKDLAGPLARLSGAASHRQIPRSVQLTKWYTPQVGSDLVLLWSRVLSYSGTKRLLAETAFSSLLLPVCRETRHWGYVCDNSNPRDNRGGDVLQCYVDTLDRLTAAYGDRDADLRARFGNSSDICKAKVLCGDIKTALAAVRPKSVTLVVTSPPYFGVCDYVKSQRLSMEWFNREIEPLRLLEIGARSKRHRRTSADEYMKDLTGSMAAVARCIRPGGHCAVILGESRARLRLMQRFPQAFAEAGFEVVLELNRRVSSQRRQAPSIKNEHIFVLSI